MKTRLTTSFIVLSIILFFINQNLKAQCDLIDWTALKALYESTNGDNWKDKTGWNEILGESPTDTCDLSNLYGVSLNENGRVYCLDFNNIEVCGDRDCFGSDTQNCSIWTEDDNNLVGTLPPELGNLSELQSLTIGENDSLTGRIPVEIGKLSNLKHLILYENKLSGVIPSELSELTNLTTLILSERLEGQIPNELGELRKLKQFRLLGAKRVTGPIPKELGNLTNLTRLDLPNNGLTGSIPEELGNLSKLTHLSLNANQLTGKLPIELENLTELTSLYIATNQLEGDLPSNLSKLKKIELLSLGQNQFTGNIPDWISVFSNLTMLYLSENQFNGSIPSGIGDLKNLEMIGLSSNKLTGGLPPEMSKLSNLFLLQVDNNNLDGCYDIRLKVLCDQIAEPYDFGGDDPFISSVSEGNNFEATWEDFCATNAGNCTIPQKCHIDDWTALKALYESTDGDNWFNNTGWQEIKGNTPTGSCDLSTLFGIHLDENGRIICLDFDGDDDCKFDDDAGGNNLIGSIPPELSKLSELADLRLARNQLNGSIPPELGKLINLSWLELRFNQLSGSIPPELGKLINLNRLDLERNQLTGSIPPELGNLINLKYLFLNSNQLTDSIPPELGKLSDLESLYLSGNEIGGSIPPALGDLSNLTNLWLNENELDGSIPPKLGKLSKLTKLMLHTNQLKGSIPSELGKLSNLLELGLSRNELDGSIPPELGKLSNLYFLYLYSNQLTGSIPSELGDLSNLIGLYLEDNELSGSIPPELANLSNLTWLRININDLSGCYDANLAILCTQLNNPKFKGNADISDGNNFDATWEEFCSTNAGTCTIPQNCHIDDWTALKALYESTNGDNWTDNTGWEVVKESNRPANCNLEILKGIDVDGNGRVSAIRLNENQLTGSIPLGLEKLSSLTTLWLNKNQLSGSIPRELGNLDMLEDLRLEENGLTGSIPSELGRLSNLLVFCLHKNPISGSIPPELGDLSKLTLLWLHNNQLTGSIPTELGNLNDLTSLYLNNNQLTGSIPIGLSKLTKLNELNLSHNLFSFEEIKFSVENMNNFSTVEKFEYSPQYYGKRQVHNVQTDTTLIFGISPEFLPPNPIYQWKKDSVNIAGETNDSLQLNNIQLEDIGEYKLHIADENYVKELEVISSIHLFVEGKDNTGAPIYLDQLIVHFDDKNDEALEEYLNENDNITVMDSCNCNRNLYLLHADTATVLNSMIDTNSAETAIVKKPEIDDPHRPINTYNWVNNGLMFEYEHNSDPIFGKEIIAFMLDTGLDSLIDNNLFDDAPVDSCLYSRGITAPGYGYLNPSVTTNFQDDNNHGTFGIRAVTKGINFSDSLKVIPLKIFNENGKGNLFKMICAIYHGVDHNADIINISAGYIGQESEVLKDAIQYAQEKGVFIVASAGNDSINIDEQPQYPAYYAKDFDNVISVASIDHTNQLSNQSNYGAESVTLSAYGENIAGNGISNDSIVLNGTSVSNFFVARELALEIAKEPGRDYKQIRADFIINRTVDNTDDDYTITGKRLNANLIEILNICFTPSTIQLKNLSNNSVFITTDKFNNTESYVFQYRLKDGEEWQTANSKTIKNTIRITLLEPCTEYEIRMKSICSLNNESMFSNPNNFTTTCEDPTLCFTPSVIQIENISSNSVLITTDKFNNTESYVFEYRAKVKPVVAWETVSSPNNTMLITGLEPCKEYEVRIKSICSNSKNNESMFSNSNSFTTSCENSCDASFISQKISKKVINISESSSVSITMKNTSSVTWQPRYIDSKPVTIHNNILRKTVVSKNYENWLPNYQLQSLHKGILLNQISLKKTVPPGESVTFNFQIKAPSTPGTYNFQWQMFEKKCGRFGESTPLVKIVVENPDCIDLRKELQKAQNGLKILEKLEKEETEPPKLDFSEEKYKLQNKIIKIKAKMQKLDCR